MQSEHDLVLDHQRFGRQGIWVWRAQPSLAGVAAHRLCRRHEHREHRQNLRPPSFVKPLCAWGKYNALIRPPERTTETVGLLMFNLAGYRRHERNQGVKTNDLPDCNMCFAYYHLFAVAAVNESDKWLRGGYDCNTRNWRGRWHARFRSIFRQCSARQGER
jgi:hypothetical protein